MYKYFYQEMIYLVLSKSSNIHSKYNNIEKNIGQLKKQVLQNQTFYQNNKLNNTSGIIKNLKDGIDEWDYYFVYSHLYLNHSLTTTIQNDLGSVGGVIASLLGAIPEIAAVAGIVAAILIAQWYIWNIPSYDNGNGVGINLIGIVPNTITSVWAQ